MMLLFWERRREEEEVEVRKREVGVEREKESSMGEASSGQEKKALFLSRSLFFSSESQRETVSRSLSAKYRAESEVGSTERARKEKKKATKKKGKKTIASLLAFRFPPRTCRSELDLNQESAPSDAKSTSRSDSTRLIGISWGREGRKREGFLLTSRA